MLKRIRGYIHKYEKYVTPVALVGGFVLDSLTLRRVDRWAENILLLSYLVVVFAGIALMRYSDTRKELKYRSVIFTLIQFALGGLFSAFTIFYSRSGSWVASWPFLLVLLGFMVSVEFMKRYYARFMLQMMVAYLALFSYLIFVMPLITKTIGPWTFLFSGAISLLIMWPYIQHVGERRNWFGVMGTFLLVTVLYFTHIIPPIPLSLTDSRVTTYIQHMNGEYVFAPVEQPWYAFLPMADTIKITRGSPIYFYSSVFSPTTIKADIIHSWQYFDEKSARWVPVSRIRFPIIGGRQEGYRGYSVKSNVFEGVWRVDVETEYGQLIGRKRFVIKYK
jgi:Protein of unknown function (DUF2914)